MTEEENKDVLIQEAVVPDDTSKVSDDEESPSETQPEASTEEKKSSKDYNWRRMEEKNEVLERQVEELLRKDQERNAPPPPIEEDELDDLAPDDILTVEQSDRRNEKAIKRLMKEAQLKQDKASLPEKARKKFDDFDSIMTKDNVKKLEQLEPGLAEACSKASNPWEATYKLLKKFVLPPEERESSQSEKRLDENLSKPGSINSVGKTKPLSNANMYSAETKDRLYKDMMDAARQV